METRLSGREMALEAGPDDDEERFAPIAYLADPHAEPSDVLAQRQYAHLQDEGLHTRWPSSTTAAAASSSAAG
jgi:RNA polymerase sigma-32 factor